MPSLSRISGGYQSDSSARKREIIRKLTAGSGSGGPTNFTSTASLTVTEPGGATINENAIAINSMGFASDHNPAGQNFNPGLTWSFTLPTGVVVRNYRIIMEDLSFIDTDTGLPAVHWDITVPPTVTSITSSLTANNGQTSRAIWSTRASEIRTVYVDSAQDKINNRDTLFADSSISIVGYSGPNPPFQEIHTYRLSVTANLFDGTTTNMKLTQSRSFRFGSGTNIAATGTPREANNLNITYNATAYTPITTTITSTNFTNLTALPVAYNQLDCVAGSLNTSPQLQWSATGSTNLISRWKLRMVDTNGNTGSRPLDHWNVQNIPVGTTSIAQNGTWPTGVGIDTTQSGFQRIGGDTSVRSNGYTGPCGAPLAPGSEEFASRYFFTVIGYDVNGNEVPGANATIIAFCSG